MGYNNLGPEGGAAIAEALKVNKTVVDIKCVPALPCEPHRRHAFACYRRGNKTHADHSARSLEYNSLGPEGGAAIAEALKVNETVTTIKCVLSPREPPHLQRLRLLPTG